MSGNHSGRSAQHATRPPIAIYAEVAEKSLICLTNRLPRNKKKFNFFLTSILLLLRA